MGEGTLDRIAQEAGRLLKGVATVLAQDGGPRHFVNSLGWELPPGVDDLGLRCARSDQRSWQKGRKRSSKRKARTPTTPVLAERFAELLVELVRTVTELRAVVAGFSATGDLS